MSTYHLLLYCDRPCNLFKVKNKCRLQNKNGTIISIEKNDKFSLMYIAATNRILLNGHLYNYPTKTAEMLIKKDPLCAKLPMTYTSHFVLEFRDLVSSLYYWSRLVCTSSDLQFIPYSGWMCCGPHFSREAPKCG